MEGFSVRSCQIQFHSYGEFCVFFSDHTLPGSRGLRVFLRRQVSVPAGWPAAPSSSSSPSFPLGPLAEGLFMEERTQEPGEGQGPGPLSKLTAVGGTQWQTLCPPAPVPPTPVSPPSCVPPHSCVHCPAEQLGCLPSVLRGLRPYHNCREQGSMTEQWAWRSHSTCLLGFLAGKPGSREAQHRGRKDGFPPSQSLPVGHQVLASFSCCWALAFRIVG